MYGSNKSLSSKMTELEKANYWSIVGTDLSILRHALVVSLTSPYLPSLKEIPRVVPTTNTTDKYSLSNHPHKGRPPMMIYRWRIQSSSLGKHHRSRRETSRIGRKLGKERSWSYSPPQSSGDAERRDGK